MTMLVSLGTMAQETSSVVVNSNGQGVRFQMNQVDSICFNTPDKPHIVTAESLFKASEQLSQIKIDSLTQELKAYTESLFGQANQRTDQLIDKVTAMFDEVKRQLQRSNDSLKTQWETMTNVFIANHNRQKSGHIISDSATGKRYKLTVKDGALMIEPFKYGNILILGNSFTHNGTKEGVWWSWHSMAATNEATAYTSYIQEVADIQLVQYGVWSFEADYSPDFDFGKTFPISVDYEAIIVQAQENSFYRPNMQISWEALYDYLQSKCPNALIIQTVGWYNAECYRAIRQAALNKNVTFLDNCQETMTGNSRPGDYVIGRDGQYHAIQIQAVADHPSDVGLYLTANNLLDALDMPRMQRLHQLRTEEAKGGKLSLAYGQWPERGVVSIRAVPDEGKTLSTLSVTSKSGKEIEATRRHNAFFDGTDYVYYTFIMPDEDVTITPVWE